MKLIPAFSIPGQVYSAISGGVDSIAITHFLNQRKVLKAAVWYNHGDTVSANEKDVCERFCAQHDIELIVGDINSIKITPEYTSSKEGYWSNQRNGWFQEMDRPVVTGHNLNDVAEYYLMTCIRGEGHYTKPKNQNILRPFLTTEKKYLEEYVAYYGLQYFDDPTNYNIEYTQRNRIRHNILPEVLKINPGFLNTMKRNIIKKANEISST